jgi:hypothetical protein
VAVVTVRKPRPPVTAVVATARSLGVDALTIEVLRALRSAGCRAILLRGPAIRHHLGDERTYGDMDLLVAPSVLPQAGAALASLGLELGLDHHAHPGAAEPHAQEWGRPGGAHAVDLHWRIPGVEAPPERAWEILAGCAEPMPLGGEPAEALRAEGIALVVALHAAYHGRTQAKPLRDLELALDRLGADTWRDAARLAAELDATDAFSAGVRLLPAGERLADGLGLGEVRSAQRVLLAGDQPDGALGLLRIMRPAPARERLRALRYALLPSPEYVRAYSDLARRGRRGLALAYVIRAARRAVRLPAAIRAVRAARRGG